jgi:hypothetical protein
MQESSTHDDDQHHPPPHVTIVEWNHSFSRKIDLSACGWTPLSRILHTHQLYYVCIIYLNWSMIKPTTLLYTSSLIMLFLMHFLDVVFYNIRKTIFWQRCDAIFI